MEGCANLLLMEPWRCRNFRKSSEAFAHWGLANRASTSSSTPGKILGSSKSLTTKSMSGRNRTNLHRQHAWIS